MSVGIETNSWQIGEAGHCGSEVRSDARVRIEARDTGGIAIELESRVFPYYGDAIRRQAEGALEALGVEHARVEIHDEGALPFVLAARIEAAARRAGLGQGRRVLPDRVTLPEPFPRDRMRRSRLYVPGSEPKYFINAALHGADAIILDLEDSVHPNEKDAARLLVRNALRAVDFLRCERMVRINQLPLGLEDLEEIVPESPDLILIPKVETSDQILHAHQKIAEIKGNYGITRPIWLMPILESALGIEMAYDIATANKEIVALTIGILVVFCAWLSWKRLGGKNPMSKLAFFWLALVGCQIALGAWTVWSNKAADVATLHVLVGALSLVTGALWCIIAFGRREGATKIAPAKTISGAFGTSSA